MLNIRVSTTTVPSDLFVESARKKGEDNLKWLKRHMAELTSTGVSILLVGGNDASSMRLRFAQAHVRTTLDPSHWSHVALIEKGGRGDPKLVEISLNPPNGFGFAAPTNGVQHTSASLYSDPAKFPNIAVLHYHCSVQDRDAVLNSIDRFAKQRSVLDATELIVMWLAFVWGVGKTPNPLLDSHAIPSAAMIEILCSAGGFDITPGFDSRASCPEAIWQSAKWWKDFYVKSSPTGSDSAAPAGFFTTTHKLDFPDER